MSICVTCRVLSGSNEWYKTEAISYAFLILRSLETVVEEGITLDVWSKKQYA